MFCVSSPRFLNLRDQDHLGSTIMKRNRGGAACIGPSRYHLLFTKIGKEHFEKKHLKATKTYHPVTGRRFNARSKMSNS